MNATCPHCGASSDISEYADNMDFRPDANALEVVCDACDETYFADIWVEISTSLAGVAKTFRDAEEHGPTWVKAPADAS